MKKNTGLWILVGVLILVIILIAPRAFVYGRGVAMRPGYGMMDHDMAFSGMMDFNGDDFEMMDFGDDDFGMMEFSKSSYGMMDRGKAGYRSMGHGMAGFGWLIPALLFVLLIAAGVWLGNVMSSRKFLISRQANVCPHCSKPADDDWSTCPYCSKSLKK